MLVIFIGMAHADTPQNVKCAIMAQEAARNRGSEYQVTYNRKFEFRMLNGLTTERQTASLEKARPDVFAERLFTGVSEGKRAEPRSLAPGRLSLEK